MPVQTSYPTTPNAALEGQLAHADGMLSAEIKSMYSAEASAEIPFGYGVKWGSATDGKAAKLPALETDKVAGVVVFSHSYENGPNGELGTTGVKPGGKLHVLRKGVIWVKVRTGCAPGDRAWLRCTATPGAVGSWENADDGTETIDCTAQGVFESYAAADGMAKLRVDFTNA